MYQIQDLRQCEVKTFKNVKKGDVIEVGEEMYIVTQMFGDRTLYLFEIKTAELWLASDVFTDDTLVKMINAEIRIIDDEEL